MPIYSCTANDATLTADTKTELARDIATIHSSINHVPSVLRQEFDVDMR